MGIQLPKAVDLQGVTALGLTEQMQALVTEANKRAVTLIEEEIAALNQQRQAYDARGKAILEAVAEYGGLVEQTAEVHAIIMPQIQKHTEAVENGISPVPKAITERPRIVAGSR